MDSVLTTFHLNPASFPDAYLAFFVPIHAAAAIIAAVIFCPLAIFATKGSRLHRRAGQSVVFLSAILVVTSFFLAADKGINSIVVNASVFPAGEYNQFYLVLLSIVFSYYVFSAARIWPRLAAGKNGDIAANWFDWTLTVLVLIVAFIYLFTSIAMMGPNNALAAVYLLAALLATPLSCLDLFTFLAPQRFRRFPWWLLHMAKMVLVWATLVHFIFLRVLNPAVSEYVIDQILYLWVVFALWVIVAVWHWPVMQSGSEKDT